MQPKWNVMLTELLFTPVWNSDQCEFISPHVNVLFSMTKYFFLIMLRNDRLINHCVFAFVMPEIQITAETLR